MIEDDEGFPSQNIRGGQNLKPIKMEDETTLSHREDQGETHTNTTNEVIGVQFQEPVGKKKLTYIDIQKEDQIYDQQKHLDAILIKFEEVRLLEKWIRVEIIFYF